ncbi:MAG: M23 family metallopeptidase [Gemmatimonadales bacterium]|nr:M23 family metallopeptidase [Gemmatimonadota bacterium]MBP6442928.1 M23 family metallopeptidase [Gemmatimonadales bacterium]MBP6569984.1 M23 family metallopeptidase [Gemmatimonadales bacterium]
MRFQIPRFPLAAAVLAAAALIVSRGEYPWQRLSDVPTAGPIVVSDPYHTVSDTLQRGETVGALLARHGVTGLDLSALASALRFDPRRFRAGQVFSVRRGGAADEATQVEFRASPEQRVQFIRTANGEWRGNAVAVYWSTDTIRLAATITSNLFNAIDDEVSDATLDRQERANVVYALAEVFSYSVDFSRDIQVGDRFTAVVERRTSEDGETRFGRILAGELSVGGKAIAAFNYRNGGQNAFYDGEGNALKRAFLAAPVDFRYVSSGLSRGRFHPVLGVFRRHEGIDYAANSGTPVRAASEGQIVRAGWAGGYGRLVEIRHRNGITTRYAHLSSISVKARPGARVGQGDIIGNVGSSGLSSGPHLHYEFRVNGTARDPRSVKMETGAPLPKGDLVAFRQERDRLRLLLGPSLASPPARGLAE